MKPFSFRLESLLKYRQHQRDLCRQLLAEVLNDQAQHLQSLEQIAAERTETEASQRAAGQQGPISVRQMASRRYYMSHLDLSRRTELGHLERIEQQLDLCRQALRQADTAVKALEKLRDKQQREHQLAQLKAEDLVVQDTWSGMRHSQS